MHSITRDSVLAALAGHIGARRGIHGQQLVAEILGAGEPDPASERRLRNVITELRMDGHHICGTPTTGYFMASQAEELDATCEFLYDRALASLNQIARMKRIALPDLRGQLKLPT